MPDEKISMDTAFGVPIFNAKEVKKEIKQINITNSDSFKEAIKTGDTENIRKAEEWLTTIKHNWEDFPQYGDREIDHREAELMHYYRDVLHDYKATKRIIEDSVKPSSKTNRIKRLKELLIERKTELEYGNL